MVLNPIRTGVLIKEEIQTSTQGKCHTVIKAAIAVTGL